MCADNLKFVQNQATNLAGAGATTGDVTLVLTSFTDPDGVVLSMTDFGNVGFGTIEPNSGTNEEQISFSGITQNGNGTCTLTGVYSIPFKSPYTPHSGLLKTHAGGTIFVISNTAGFYDKLVSKDDDESITGLYTFSQLPVTATDIIPTTDKQLVPKKYYTDNTVLLTGNQNIAGVKTFASLPTIPILPLAATDAVSKDYADNLAYIAGSPNMNLTTKGIGEEATAAEILAGTQAGATGAELVVNPKYLYEAGFRKERVYVGIAAPALKLPTANLTWEDWDLSSYIPAGALYADIVATIGTTGGAAPNENSVGARKKGTSINRRFIPITVNQCGPVNFLTELDANRVVEIYGMNASNYTGFTVIGYWI